jgi:hypothetical protein
MIRALYSGFLYDPGLEPKPESEPDFHKNKNGSTITIFVRPQKLLSPKSNWGWGEERAVPVSRKRTGKGA